MSIPTGEFDTDEVAAVFGRAAATYDRVIPFFAGFGSRLVEVAGLALGERVLDAGCGRGATLLPASVAVGASGRVVGVDLSEVMVTMLSGELAAAGIDNATVRIGDVQALDIEDDAFDVVLSQMVLHLLPDPARGASESLRVLIPGGRCVASVPSGSPGWEFLGQVFGKFGPRALRPVLVPYRPDFNLPSVLAGAGFEILRDEQVELTFNFPDEQAWWDWGWSHGLRGLYEVLAPEDLEGLRQEAFAAMAAVRTPDGIPLVQRANFVVAAKPASH
ncbi:MAG TPA: methyltransferase domain-containing protein [Acidimicrobiales bacterium]|nr:methyltransferase domain-containing protein [Acidimicrobiales bacterium]